MHKCDSVRTDKRPHEKLQKQYQGKRSSGQCFVTVNGRALDPRFDLRFHSLDGFEWGYGGKDPAQLGLALLAEWLSNDSKALSLRLLRESWTLSGREMDQALNTLRDEACT